MKAKKHKKLSKKDLQTLWGENTPYSEVGIIEQTRILGDGISRIFLVIEAKINPFTFEYVFKNRNEFADDLKIQDLLDHAEYRGLYDGYVVCAGEEELIDAQSIESVNMYKQILIEQVLKMHNFVIESFDLQRNVVRDLDQIELENSKSSVEPNKYVWSDFRGIVPIDETVLEASTTIINHAGIKNKYFIILVLASSKKTLTDAEIDFTAPYFRSLTKKFKIDIENISGNRGYLLITVLIDFDNTPADFIEAFIQEANTYKKGAIFCSDYLITNVARPTFSEVESFLRKINKKK